VNLGILENSRKPLYRWRWALALTISAIAIAVVGTALLHPSDAKLRALLSTNKRAFEQLLRMLAEDREIISLSPRFILWEHGEASGEAGGYKQRDFDKGRWDQYRELLAAIGSRDGLEVKKDDGVIVFIESVLGAFLSGTRKGIAYQYRPSLDPSVKIVGNLDDNAALPEGEYLSPIGSGWYIYFDKF
jgi:hypothetical protein